MIRKKLTAALAVCMAIVTLFSTTAFAYTPEEESEEVYAETVMVDENEELISEGVTEPDIESEESDIGSEKQDIESEKTDISLDTSEFFGRISGLDPEILEVITEHPKLAAMFLPTLHVTIRDNSMTISIDNEDSSEEVFQSGTVVTGGENLNVRTDAGIENEIITQLSNGDGVKILSEKDGWYEVEIPAKYGYVCGNYIKVNNIPSIETDGGYSFDIDAEMLLSFLDLFSEEEPEETQAVQGLTPDGNLTLIDDLGERTGSGQQFVTLITKNGNYFYLIIDRDEKGQETVHFLNMVDEQDLFALMEDDDADALQKQQAELQASIEAAEKAASDVSDTENGADQTKQDGEASEKKSNPVPVLIVVLLMAAAGIGWFMMQTKKKKQVTSYPDPDADYYDDEDYADESPEADDRDPYEDETLDEDPDETEDSMEDE